MATYHCSVKVGGKGQASGHAAYIAREGRYAERAGYEDLEATGYGNLPSWAEHQPSLFWSAADRHERANSTTYRELELALPRELNPEQRHALVLDFIQHEIGARHAHQWAIHNPGAALAGGEQPHVHLMYSERTVDGLDRDPEQYFKRYNGKHPELGGCRKDSAGTEERLLETRQRWAEVQNAHLQQHGHAARVDHRSLADQGIDRAPEQHLGGRRVRQLEPEHREALLERREAEHELRQSQYELEPFDLQQQLLELTAAAAARQEQKEHAARMAEARAYCQHALNAFRAELVQQAEQERALDAERAHPQRLDAEHVPPEPLPAIEPRSLSFAESLQAALAKTMEQLQAQREPSPAQEEPPPPRSRGFDLEP